MLKNKEMNRFDQFGHYLHNAGFSIIPIKPREKAPVDNEWTTTETTTEDIDSWIKNRKRHGIGIKTGELCAVDIDCDDIHIVRKFIDYCIRNHGDAPMRGGSGEHKLLVYKNDDADRKKQSSVKFVDPFTEYDQQLEILGKGQQFVAYGIHPKTGSEYPWCGKPLHEWSMDDIPTLANEDIDDLIECFTSYCKEADFELKKAASKEVSSKEASSAVAFDYFDESFVPPLDLSDEDINKILDKVDVEDYDAWLIVGMACHHQYTGLIEGLDKWDKCSKQSDKYDGDELNKKWASFGKSSHNPTTFATLIKNTGFKRDNKLPKHGKHRTRSHDVCMRMMRKVENELNFKITCSHNTSHMMLASSFWQPKESKLHTINKQNEKVIFGEKDAVKVLMSLYGNPIKNYEEYCDHLSVMVEDKKLNPINAKMHQSVVVNGLLDSIKMNNQRLAAKMDVDMFSSRTYFDFDKYHVIEHHVFSQFKSDQKAFHDDIAVNEYKQHFPEFDETLRFILGARFASSRKKAYLWIKAPSDWGKDFFRVALGRAAVEMSVKEIEKAMEGAPVGKSPIDFLEAWALCVNEFKGVKSELKQLENSITLSAKFQLETRVNIYAKIFFSADDVESLQGEYGVETQFANRFSLIEGMGDIKDVPSFKRLGPKFLDAIKTYVVEFFNKGVEDYRALGYDGSREKGDSCVNAYHGKHGISKTHGERSLEQGIEELADTIKDAIYHHADRRIISYDGFDYLFCAHTLVNDILYTSKIVSRGEAATLKHKIKDICKTMGEDIDQDGVKKGVTQYRLGDEINGKALKIKPPTKKLLSIF